MDDYNFILSKIHAFSGIVIFIAGILQIVLRKGGKLHRVIGQVYFWTWIPLILTGVVIGSLLIAFFGLLGFYMAYTGYLFGKRKSMKLSLFDKIMVSLFTAAAIYLLVWAILLLIKGAGTGAYVAFFFGVIFSLNMIQDFREYILKQKHRKLSGHKMQWYFEHFGRMYVSFIAATTAFCALQEIFPIEILNWTLPTVIGTLLIILSNKKYQKKMNIKI